MTLRSASKGISVYIHTRSRLGYLDKVLPAWFEQKGIGRITIVVEPGERWATYRHLREACPGAIRAGKVRVEPLPQADRGMGAARAWVVQHAYALGEEVIIMSDDDLYPMRGRSDARLLVNEVKDKDILGIGVCVSFYGLSLGNDYIRESCEAVPVSGAWGYRCFALNVRMAIKAGQAYGVDWAFDPALDVGWEDHEVTRMGIAQLGEGWWIHTGVMATSIGARYADGGIAALLPDREQRHRRESACHERIFVRWGERYISNPHQGRKYRCNWSKFRADHGL